MIRADDQVSAMLIHFATADTTGADRLAEGLVAVSASANAPARRPSSSPPAKARREVHCRGCGYGAVVAHRLLVWPMCGDGDWLRVPAEAIAGGRAVRRDGRHSDSGRRQL